MSAVIGLTQTQIFTATVAALRSFGLVSGAGLPIPIIRGQVNRVPEPAQPDFAVLWPISRQRLKMNEDAWLDTICTGSIASNVLNVTIVAHGALAVGQTIFAASGVAAGTQITAQLTGTPGGIGTYAITPTGNLGSSLLYPGTLSAMQATEVTIQADIHGPASADNAARVATLWRDQFGVSAFNVLGVDIAPLYTSDPRQIAFENGEQQTEERWSVDLCMQANVAITTAQQFAAALKTATTPVEAYQP